MTTLDQMFVIYCFEQAAIAAKDNITLALAYSNMATSAIQGDYNGVKEEYMRYAVDTDIKVREYLLTYSN